MKFLLTKRNIQQMIDKSIQVWVEYLIKRCKTCGSGLIKYKEFSPDGLPYYFCSKKCYKKWKRESGEVYRALELRKIE